LIDFGICGVEPSCSATRDLVNSKMYLRERGYDDGWLAVLPAVLNLLGSATVLVQHIFIEIFNNIFNRQNAGKRGILWSTKLVS
jgi:hypothetical protein